jgi:hypothetical protein
MASIFDRKSYMKQWRADNNELIRKQKRKDALKSKYGISVEDYESMLESQGGVCAVCGDINSDRRLAVDHDHATGEVRGLLCTRCNVAIGFVMEDQDRIIKIQEYLSRW